jgi:hypothetical protein
MMPAQQTQYIPWRDRAFVSFAETGEIVGRTVDWVRERVLDGRLQAAQVTPGGPLAVTTASLCRLIDDAVPAGPRQLASLRQRRAPPERQAPCLRLVVSNEA